MKIIGTTPVPYSKPNFIVQMSADEMYKITNSKACECGDTIDVISTMYRLAQIDGMEAQRAKIAEQLRALAGLVELIPPIVIPKEQQEEDDPLSDMP